MNVQASSRMCDCTSMQHRHLLQQERLKLVVEEVARPGNHYSVVVRLCCCGSCGVYVKTSVVEMSVVEMSVVEMSVVEMRVVEMSVVEMSVVEMSVVEMRVVEMSVVEMRVVEMSVVEMSVVEMSVVEMSEYSEYLKYTLQSTKQHLFGLRLSSTPPLVHTEHRRCSVHPANETRFGSERGD